jgi:hypothetical protein
LAYEKIRLLMAPQYPVIARAKGDAGAVKGVIGPKKTIFLYATEKRRKPLTDKALGLPKSLWRLLEALAWARLTA